MRSQDIPDYGEWTLASIFAAGRNGKNPAGHAAAGGTHFAKRSMVANLRAQPQDKWTHLFDRLLDPRFNKRLKTAGAVLSVRA